MERPSSGLPVSVLVGRGGGRGAGGAKQAKQASVLAARPSTRRLGCLRVNSCGGWERSSRHKVVSAGCPPD